MKRISRKNRLLTALLALALLLWAVVPPLGPALAETEAEDIAEWTVMLYMCGSDLEADDSMGTDNLKAIARTHPVPGVNFVIETGGARKWHSAELGMDVDPSKLERWTWTDQGFQKVGEAELASMGERLTLADFLTWTMENYPAKKYQLIIWDHGGGSMYGVACDQLYGMDALQLFDIAGALKDSGIQLELFMTDTCLMATLEMLEAVSPYAKYFVGCEEALSGYGSNYASYVQYLYDYPECDGVSLGKRICSSTQQMYSDKDFTYDLGFLTMSLVDLSRVAAVRAAFDDFIAEVEGLLDDPAGFYDYCFATRNREKYVFPECVDIYDLAERASGHGVSAKTAIKLENAVEAAVLSNVRGEDHIRSHGISVYYKLNESPYRLDHYSRVCADPAYLALLDRVNYSWKAPDWVYEAVARKRDVGYKDYTVNTAVSFSEETGVPRLQMDISDNFIIQGAWELLQYAPDTDLWRIYGRDPFLTEESDDTTLRWASTFDGTWPSLGGVPLTLSVADEQEAYILFTAPMKVADDTDKVRILYRLDVEEGESPQYKLFGSAPLDNHTGFPDRDIEPLSEGAAIEPLASLLDQANGTCLNYSTAEPFEYESDMQITREPLPAGEYAVRFVVTDVFGNETSTGPVSCTWDGDRVTWHQDAADGE